MTPTPTPTTSPGSSPTPTPTSTNTPTPTPTPTPSPFVEQFAYLFIEPVTGSTNIGEWMFNNGSNFFGFTNYSQPTQNQSTFDFDLNTYVSFTGWTSGLFPQIITQTVPQVSGGIDSFGNSIVAFNFTTTRVLEGTVPVNSWYTWIIPISATNNLFNFYFYLNTSATLVGATLVATNTSVAAATRAAQLYRRLTIDVAAGTGNGTIVLNTSYLARDDVGAANYTTGFSTLTTNWTVDQYIIVSGSVVSTLDSLS